MDEEDKQTRRRHDGSLINTKPQPGLIPLFGFPSRAVKVENSGDQPSRNFSKVSCHPTESFDVKKTEVGKKYLLARRLRRGFTLMARLGCARVTRACRC